MSAIIPGRSWKFTSVFALNLGWTEEELTEALLHLSGYIGVPSVREAMIIADRVFKEERDGGE